MNRVRIPFLIEVDPVATDDIERELERGVVPYVATRVR